jgi:hypothetical protein
MTISDDILIRYADGEASADDRLLVEAALAADPAVAERLAAHQRLAARVQAAFASAAEAPVPQALLDLLNKSGPLPADSQTTVVPLNQFRGRKVPAAPAWMAWAAMAACLVIGVMVGAQSPWSAGPGLVDRQQNARGALMAALDGQLASQPAKGEAVRVGVSFRKAGGGICRTYTADSSAGLACRDGGKWKVMVAVAQGPAASNEFRTAGSETPPAVLEAMDGLIVGEPLDAAGEAAARKAGWR